MFALFCFILAVMASPFKSKSRLEAENAALRHQLVVDFITTMSGFRFSVHTGILTRKKSMSPIDQPPTIVCSIIRQDIGDRLQIRGRVIGRPEAQGDFSLQIVKTGPSGSSALSQSGTFSIPKNREKLLGSAIFNRAPEDHFTAELSLRVDGQTYTCKSSDKKSQ